MDVLKNAPAHLLEVEAEFDFSDCLSSGGFVLESLSAMDKLVQRIFSTGHKYALLVAKPLDERIKLYVRRFGLLPISAYVIVKSGASEATAVRYFLERNRFQAPPAPPESGKFYPAAPIYLCCNIAPMPGNIAEFSRVATSLFVEICGLNGLSAMRFDYTEWVDRKKAD